MLNHRGGGEEGGASSVSMSANSSTVSLAKHLALRLSQIRKTVLGAQNSLMHTKEIADHNKRAHKRATELYTRAKKKPCFERMFSKEVTHQVR